MFPPRNISHFAEATVNYSFSQRAMTPRRRRHTVSRIFYTIIILMHITWINTVAQERHQGTAPPVQAPAHQVVVHRNQTYCFVYLSSGARCQGKGEHILGRFGPPSMEFCYLHRGAGVESFETSEETDRLGERVKIVRSDLVDGNLFAFGIAIYYQFEMCIFIDLDRAAPADEELEEMLGLLVMGNLEVVFDSSDPRVIVAKQAVIRRFSLYTDVRYSNESALRRLYKACRYGNLAKYMVQDDAANLEGDREPIEFFKCPKSSGEDFVFLIPTFRRDYLERTVRSIMQQTVLPSQIYIFQNRMHVTFNFTHIKSLTTIPIHHVWVTNWNSLYYMTYMSVMFTKETYFIKMDDDFFPTSSTGVADYLSYVTTHPKTMIGVRGFRAGYNCGCKVIRKSRRIGDHPWVDHIGCIVMIPTSSAKILHRFKPYVLYYGEDASISVMNSIECGFKSIIRPFEYTDVSDSDGKASFKSFDFQKTLKRDSNPLQRFYTYFVRGGYKPRRWVAATCPYAVDTEFLRAPH